MNICKLFVANIVAIFLLLIVGCASNTLTSRHSDPEYKRLIGNQSEIVKLGFRDTSQKKIDLLLNSLEIERYLNETYEYDLVEMKRELETIHFIGTLYQVNSSISKSEQYFNLCRQRAKEYRIFVSKDVIKKNPPNKKITDNQLRLAQEEFDSYQRGCKAELDILYRLIGKKIEPTAPILKEKDKQWEKVANGHLKSQNPEYLKSVVDIYGSLDLIRIQQVFIEINEIIRTSIPNNLNDKEYIENVEKILKKRVLVSKGDAQFAALLNLRYFYELSGKKDYKNGALWFTEFDKKLVSKSSNKYGETSDFTAAMRRLLGETEEKSGKNKRGLESALKKNIQIQLSAKGKKDFNLLISEMHGLAGIYIKEKKYSSARSIYNQIATIIKSNEYRAIPGYGADPHKDHLDSEVAKLKLLEGDQRAMVAMLEAKADKKGRALLSFEKRQLMNQYLRIGEGHKAIKYWKEALRADTLLMRRALLDLGGKARGSYKKNNAHHSNLDSDILDFYAQAQMPESNQEALYFSITRKGILQSLVAESNRLLRETQDPVLKKKKAALERMRKNLSNLSLNNESLSADINLLKNKIYALENELNRALFKHYQFEEITSNQVLEKLKNNEVIIDFHLFTSRNLKKEKDFGFGVISSNILAIVVDREGVSVIDLGHSRDIAEAIQIYRNKLRQRHAQADLTAESQKLYQFLWQPLQKYLVGKNTAYLVADGTLHLFPFKALQDSEGHYLVEKFYIKQLTSVRDLVLEPKGINDNQAIIFASPSYSSEVPAQLSQLSPKETRSQAELFSQLYFAPLPGTLSEGKSLLALMEQDSLPVKLNTAEQATEKSVKAVKSPKILHLATHGYFLQSEEQDIINLSLLNSSMANDPLLSSGLAFAHANLGIKGKTDESGDNGILTALEILQMDLSGTDLVTLSACETGIGAIQAGQGVYSLSRSFQEAGAKSVMSSLWQISDNGTLAFMKRFYKRYLSKGSTQQALRETQLEFIKSKAVNHPYYWAAFVMTGND